MELMERDTEVKHEVRSELCELASLIKVLLDDLILIADSYS
jgi:hypothetical protein